MIAVCLLQITFEKLNRSCTVTDEYLSVSPATRLLETTPLIMQFRTTPLIQFHVENIQRDKKDEEAWND